MHCSPQLEPAEGSPSLTCRALKTVSCTNTEVPPQTHKTRSLAAHYMHATLICNIQRKALKDQLTSWRQVGSWKGRSMIKNAVPEGGVPDTGTQQNTRCILFSFFFFFFTWAQASGPPAQVDRQGQVDIIVALSLPAGPVEWKLSIFSPL